VHVDTDIFAPERFKMKKAAPNLRLVSSDPVPIWHVVINESGPHWTPPINLENLQISLSKTPFHPGDSIWNYLYRGLSIDRLSKILLTGIDVEPPEQHIFVDCIEKTWEYGG
jgi:hypothetical protein